MAVASSLNAAELEAQLVLRAARLRHYVALKIPPTLVRTISPDDILQETWTAAFEHVRGFVPGGPDALDRWLITIANRKLIDAVRAARRAPIAPLPSRGALHSSSMVGLIAQVAAAWRSPSREASLREAADAIQTALADMPVDRRRAILLRFVDGLSLKQIAAQLGKSYAAVNSLLFHGLRELRTQLGHATKFFSDARSVDAPTDHDDKSGHV